MSRRRNPYKVSLWCRIAVWWQQRKTRAKVCSEKICSGRDRRHEPCVDCGAVTCYRRTEVDPRTLRRRRVPACNAHSFAADKAARTARSRRDWEETDVPVSAELLTAGLPPNQYEGACREAIRAFRDSDDSNAVVDGLTPSALNASIESLGLDGEMYAEQRDGRAVLRRVGDRVRA